MRYLDYVCAWMVLLSAVLFIVRIATMHPRGAVLDIPILWILVAMMNFLRLRNGYGVRGLRTSCIGANVMTLFIEIVRLKLFGGIPLMIKNWGPYTLVFALAVSAEAIFSLMRQSQPSSTRSDLI